MNPSQLNKLKKLLSKPCTVSILTHWSPDGDAMGSSLGLYHYLKSCRHKPAVITPNDYAYFLRWLPGDDKVINYQEEKEKALRHLQRSQIIFCLDFNSLKRIDELGTEVEKMNAVKVMIDHHPEPDPFADFRLHTVKASSTAELVYEFILMTGGRKKINRAIANCLYTGIMTDTGSFKFASTTAKTHRIIAGLIDAGAQHTLAHEKIYDTSTYGRLRLLGYSLSEKLVVLPEHKTAFISLTEKELKRFGYQKGDTEGLVNYGLTLENIVFSAFFAERDGCVKVSFRSKGRFDTNLFARRYFSGGGHRNASGGSSKGSLRDTINTFLNALSHNHDELQNS